MVDLLCPFDIRVKKKEDKKQNKNKDLKKLVERS